MRPAPTEVARAFCVDTMFHEAPFATHKIYTRMKLFERAQRPTDVLLRNCPEIRMMLKLQSHYKGMRRHL